MSKPFALVMVVLACTLVAGCGIDHEVVAERPTAVRDHLVRGEVPPRGLGAYGYVLFTRRPAAGDSIRYDAVCRRYLAASEPRDEFADERLHDLMVTHWLLREPPDSLGLEMDGVDGDDCPSMVRHYDYARAENMLSALELGGAAGPVLAAWGVSHRSDVPAVEALVWDLSRVGDDRLGSVFDEWNARIVRDPEIWDDGFDVEKVRQIAGTFVDEHGEAIVEVLRSSFAD